MSRVGPSLFDSSTFRIQQNNKDTRLLITMSMLALMQLHLSERLLPHGRWFHLDLALTLYNSSPIFTQIEVSWRFGV